MISQFCSGYKRVYTLSKLLVSLTSVILFSGCHGAVFNQVDHSTRNVLTWIGAPVKKVVLFKGPPTEVYYLGAHEISLTTTEYWTPELDRFTSLYRPYAASVNHQVSRPEVEQVYREKNAEGIWLLVYQTPLRKHKKGIRECTEFYLVDYQGQVSHAGYMGSLIGDQRHCPLPIRNSKIIPSERKLEG